MSLRTRLALIFIAATLVPLGPTIWLTTNLFERSLAPVVSLSLGDTCVFRFGNAGGRGRPWTDVGLDSGDLFVFGGPSRRAYHGVPKVLPGTGPPDIGLDGGRFNITLRQSGLEGDDTLTQP